VESGADASLEGGGALRRFRLGGSTAIVNHDCDIIRTKIQRRGHRMLMV
jgi:hypothetical protein